MNWTLKSSALGLFASFGALICCVLPVTLVSLGMGAAMASLAVNVPGLIWISAHKDLVFIFAGTMIAIAALVQYQQRNQPCPIDPELRRACLTGRRISKILLTLSIAIYLIGLTAILI